MNITQSVLNELAQESLSSQSTGTLLVCMISGLPLRIQDFSLGGRPLRLACHPIFTPENRKELKRIISHPSCPTGFLAATCLAVAHQSQRLLPTSDPLEVRRLNRALQALGSSALLSLIHSFWNDARPNLRPQIQASELVNNLGLLAYQFGLMSGQIVLAEPIDQELGFMPLRAYQKASFSKPRKEHKLVPELVFERLPKLVVDLAKDNENLLGFKHAKALKEGLDLLTMRQYASKAALGGLMSLLIQADLEFKDSILSQNVEVAVRELEALIDSLDKKEGLPELEEDMPF